MKQYGIRLGAARNNRWIALDGRAPTVVVGSTRAARFATKADAAAAAKSVSAAFPALCTWAAVLVLPPAERVARARAKGPGELARYVAGMPPKAFRRIRPFLTDFEARLVQRERSAARARREQRAVDDFAAGCGVLGEIKNLRAPRTLAASPSVDAVLREYAGNC